MRTLYGTVARRFFKSELIKHRREREGRSLPFRITVSPYWYIRFQGRITYITVMRIAGKNVSHISRIGCWGAVDGPCLRGYSEELPCHKELGKYKQGTCNDAGRCFQGRGPRRPRCRDRQRLWTVTITRDDGKIFAPTMMLSDSTRTKMPSLTELNPRLSPFAEVSS